MFSIPRSIPKQGYSEQNGYSIQKKNIQKKTLTDYYSYQQVSVSSRANSSGRGRMGYTTDRLVVVGSAEHTKSDNKTA